MNLARAGEFLLMLPFTDGKLFGTGKSALPEKPLSELAGMFWQD